ncbi:MAG: glycosyltransferase family 4 protein [Thermofilum sp.]|nr:glycosyltransferase family 4 protein [Thermofilum sp.]
MSKFFDIYVLCSDFHTFQALSNYMPSRIYWIPSLNVGEFLSLKNTIFLFPNDLSRLLESLKVDIIHIHTHFFLSNYQVVKYAKRLKIPTMLDVQGLIENKNIFVDFSQNVYIRSSLLKSLIYNVNGIRFVSAYDLLYMKKLYEKVNEKSKIIPNYVEIDKYYISEKTPFSVIWHGRLVRKKRIDYIIKAISELYSEYKISELKFYLVGYGPEYERLMRIAKKHNIIGRIFYKPYLRTRELISLLAKMEVIPYTSLYEGNPYSLLEAAACGVYPVGFKTPGTYETIRLLGGKLVNDKAVSELAAAISEIFSKGFNSNFFRKKVEEYFSPEKILSKLRNFYQEIISTV